jgi:hypothetical protein
MLYGSLGVRTLARFHASAPQICALCWVQKVGHRKGWSPDRAPCLGRLAERKDSNLYRQEPAGLQLALLATRTCPRVMDPARFELTTSTLGAALSQPSYASERRVNYTTIRPPFASSNRAFLLARTYSFRRMRKGQVVTSSPAKRPPRLCRHSRSLTVAERLEGAS